MLYFQLKLTIVTIVKKYETMIFDKKDLKEDNKISLPCVAPAQTDNV